MLFVYDSITGFFDIASSKAGGINSGVGNGGLLQIGDLDAAVRVEPLVLPAC